MLNHVTIGTNDLTRAKAFYDRIMATIGIGCIVVNEARGHVGHAEGPTTTPQIYLLRPMEGQPATVGTGQTFAFLAGDRAGVRAFHPQTDRRCAIVRSSARPAAVASYASARADSANQCPVAA